MELGWPFLTPYYTLANALELLALGAFIGWIYGARRGFRDGMKRCREGFRG